MKRLPFLAICSLSLGLLSDVCAISAPSSGLPLTVDGLGEFRFGMKLDDINALLPRKLESTRPELRAVPNCEYIRAPSIRGVSFVFVDDQLARIDVDAPGIRSIEGIEVGDRLENVLPRLSAARQEPLDHVPEGVVYVLESARQPTAISFQFDNGRLVRMISGDKKVIRYSEGCD